MNSIDKNNLYFKHSFKLLFSYNPVHVNIKALDSLKISGMGFCDYFT